MRGAGDPARFAVATAAHAFLDREAALRGDPAGAAFAAAMVENAATAFQDGGRFADGPWVTRLLREGRAALREAIGIAAEATPQQAQDALLAAAAAFRRNDAAGAAAALAPVAKARRAAGRRRSPRSRRRRRCAARCARRAACSTAGWDRGDHDATPPVVVRRRCSRHSSRAACR